MISPSRTALACTSLCLTVATAGVQGVRQCPLSERQAAFVRPAVATGLVGGKVELRHSYSQSAVTRNRGSFTAPSELRRSLDYSGQTYWFSMDIRQLLGSRAPRYWPSVLRLSAGHSITDHIDHFPSPALRLTPGVRGISWYRPFSRKSRSGRVACSAADS